MSYENDFQRWINIIKPLMKGMKIKEGEKND